ncbi:MAG: methionine gamma-lyase family protein [Clostridiales bacterium]|jgi:cystathionine beta-lyase family protein involved in aluminum resistance|nr:methionine gamma-lyase family protein [Clostridiales bacterium]
MDGYSYLKEMGISQKILDLSAEAEYEALPAFKRADGIAEYNQIKVLRSMQKNKLSDAHFAGTDGYGYHDLGREALECIYADVFKAESALVRPQLISGTHALTTALFGNLRHGDEMLSAVGKPYDTLESVIGIRPARGSLAEHGVTYRQADLTDGRINLDSIRNGITSKTRLALIQRSGGYVWRRSLSNNEIKSVIEAIKNIRSDIICLVDNCYGEFADACEPVELGADLAVGSLIKNPGGGLAPVGGYIAGKTEYVENAAFKLTAPGLGKDVGPTLGVTRALAQGFFLAPQVVNGSIKAAIFASRLFEKLGYETLPASGDIRPDIVQAIKFGSPEKVLSFCRGIQKAAPVDSFASPEPWDMPGYDAPVVMAAGAFIQGASIELSADAPMKEPYIAYFQGGLTWFHAKAGVIIAADHMLKDGLLC